jgi:hypothetical protein
VATGSTLSAQGEKVGMIQLGKQGFEMLDLFQGIGLVLWKLRVCGRKVTENSLNIERRKLPKLRKKNNGIL